MKRLLSMGAVVLIALTIAVPVRATSTLESCRETIAKAGGKFVAKKLKAIQKCNESNLKAAGTCSPASLTAAIAALVTKLNADLDKKCITFTPTLATFMGFPGKCPDANAADGFTYADLKDCIHTSHENIVDALIDVEFGTTTSVPDSATLKCQQTIDKDGAKVTNAVLKAVQKCRNGINTGKIVGTIPPNCASAEPKTLATITKAESKASADIQAKCTTDTQIQALHVCNPDATTRAGAAACVITAHHNAADDPTITESTLIDFEYAAQPVCGDGVINTLDEECDLTDDAACSGQCGSPASQFACLCLTKKRERVIEHKEADLDNGWTGASHDSGVVEGGGYVVDLYDCDGPGGPDTLCTVGPSCIGAPHPPCSNDAQCASFGGTCRKERTATGPHCYLDQKVVCTSNAQCTGFGNFCVKQFHGPPLPLSAGGISVCVLNVFSEDVVGTKDFADGSSAVRIRQKSITHLTGTASQPCPVCGGFCAASAGDLGGRHKCTTNGDCADVPPAHRCINDPVCSFGPNQDQTCRPNPPNGGPTILFGNPSVDCPPDPGSDISSGGLDILFNPATTGTVTNVPSVQCDQAAFSGKVCAGGTNNGVACTVDSECPGATCSNQCFCPGGGAVREQPNDCDAACLNGSNDGVPCTTDGDCPGGFCHLADCRPDPTAPGFLQPNEGGCTATTEGHCSVSAFRTCTTDPDCQPPACPTCGATETCDVGPKNCFINSGIVRVGVPDLTNPVSASLFCIAATHNGSVDGTSGLPGPGALRQPTTVLDTGF